MQSVGTKVHKFLDRPIRVLLVCAGFALASLSFNGGLVHLYNLHRDLEKSHRQSQIVSAEILDLDEKLTKAKDPTYITRQALDNYEIGEDQDLVFVFSDSE